MFIATANMLETIPSPLLDRLEVLQLPGYSEEEKTHIAQKYIVPKQLDLHGLAPARPVDHRRGDPQDHRRLHPRGRPAQPRARDRLDLPQVGPPPGRGPARSRSPSNPTTSPICSGPSRFFRELADRTGIPGVSTGLAWTPTGGEILFIEATGMPGKGVLTLTGLLGDSMRESAQAALSYLRSHAKLLARRRLSVRQDRPAHSRARGRRPQGRPVRRRGDRRRLDQPVPRSSPFRPTWR